MKCRALWSAIAFAVLFFAPVAPARAAWEQWPYPLAETESVLRRSLARAGFEVDRSPLASGQIVLRGRRGTERWEVTLRPHSPLATSVRAEAGWDAKDEAAQRELTRYRKEYQTGAPAGNPLPEADVPTPVLIESDFVFCIQARRGDATLLLSGFAVDAKGTVVTTAHELDNVRDVTLTNRAGVTIDGRIVRLDRAKDLALVQSEAPTRGFVRLESARLGLTDGETVFSIGCALTPEETFRRGRVRTPMRRMDSLYLWEVEMETLPGASGGPVFDAKGKPVGVVKGRLKGTDTTGFLIPVETVLRFLAGR